MLRFTFKQTGAEADLQAALSPLLQAEAASSATPSIRIRAARAAASLAAASNPGQAASLLETAVNRLPLVAPRQLYRQDQQHMLGEFDGLATDAAALILAAPSRGGIGQRAARALQLLETGRAVLLSQALETRTDLTDLRNRYPALAMRFSDLRNRLDQPSGMQGTEASPAVTHVTPQEPYPAQQYRQWLSDEFASLLAQIRVLDGFASFGLPPDTDELLADAQHGPVVTFNISSHRSDALLLTKAGISSMEIPALGHDTLIDQINAFHQTVHAVTNPDLHVNRWAAQQTLLRILEWLWDCAAEPVLRQLGYDGQSTHGGELPRVWWIPGGLLGLLPLHAAGYHSPHQSSGQPPRAVMDRVISSYAPSIRSLRQARQHTANATARSRALVVAMPTTPGLPGNAPLPNVAAETEIVRSLLTEPTVLTEPDPGETPPGGPSALPTRANVLAQLPACTIAHFACHGFSHPTDPSQSYLALHDHEKAPLTISSLAAADLADARLAYLSACTTAIARATILRDEAIHLSTAFQLAGFPHVIGTLWNIQDSIAVTVARDVYTAMRAGPGTLDTGRAAYALHHAVASVRDAFPSSPSLWGSYIHVGI